MQLILAEQLLLLFLDDENGSDQASWGGDPGLAGAILLDLTAQRALTEDDGDLVAVPGARPEHPLLAAGHAAIAASGQAARRQGLGRPPAEGAQAAARAHRRAARRAGHPHRGAPQAAGAVPVNAVP
jgi:Golgi phosphoprotein 3 (GPP34)